MRPTVPVLSDVLYESIFEAQQWMLFDANKKRVAVGDAFPASYNVKDLPKGDYVLRLNVRHEDPAVLGKLATASILLERPLAKPLALAFHGQAPVTGGKTLKDQLVPLNGFAWLGLAWLGFLFFFFWWVRSALASRFIEPTVAGAAACRSLSQWQTRRPRPCSRATTLSATSSCSRVYVVPVSRAICGQTGVH